METVQLNDEESLIFCMDCNETFEASEIEKQIIDRNVIVRCPYCNASITD